MKGLLATAASTLALFAALHLLGYREDACVLTGMPSAHPVGGVLYVLAHFGAILVAPVALLGAGLLAASTRARRRA